MSNLDKSYAPTIKKELIVNIINENEGKITANKLLIALFKKTGVIYKRKALIEKMCRLIKNNYIYRIKPGIYSTSKKEKKNEPT